MQDATNLPFTLSVFKGLSPPPSVILRTPLVADLFGAGFTKAPHSRVSESHIFIINNK
jgi:DNA ligase-4